jgi:hypothetical protein
MKSKITKKQYPVAPFLISKQTKSSIKAISYIFTNKFISHIHSDMHVRASLQSDE